MLKAAIDSDNRASSLADPLGWRSQAQSQPPKSKSWQFHPNPMQTINALPKNHRERSFPHSYDIPHDDA
jgi:hypothetical protein